MYVYTLNKNECLPEFGQSVCILYQILRLNKQIKFVLVWSDLRMNQCEELTADTHSKTVIFPYAFSSIGLSLQILIIKIANIRLWSIRNLDWIGIQLSSIINRCGHSPSVCGWGRKSARSVGISLDPSHGRVWSYEQTACKNTRLKIWVINTTKHQLWCICIRSPHEPSNNLQNCWNVPHKH